jgi:hypothetical protein
MRKTIGTVLFVLAFIAVVAGCKKIIEAVFPGFDVDLPAVSITLPAIPFAPPNEIQVATFSQHFNLDSIIRANTKGVFSARDVTSIKINQIKFSIANADQQNNIQNFESVRFTLASSTNSQAAEIAAVNFPDVYAENYLYTPTNPAELVSYFQGNEVVYSVFGKLRKMTTKPLSLTMVMTMRVK